MWSTDSLWQKNISIFHDAIGQIIVCRYSTRKMSNYFFKNILKRSTGCHLQGWNFERYRMITQFLISSGFILGPSSWVAICKFVQPENDAEKRGTSATASSNYKKWPIWRVRQADPICNSQNRQLINLQKTFLFCSWRRSWGCKERNTDISLLSHLALLCWLGKVFYVITRYGQTQNRK